MSAQVQWEYPSHNQHHLLNTYFEKSELGEEGGKPTPALFGTVVAPSCINLERNGKCQ